MKRVWITRASPGAEATAARLRALGFAPLVVPLLVVAPVAGPAIDLAGVAALAFTSASGVAAFAERCPERSLPVYAVGAATARAALDRGFLQVVSADGAVDDLARLIGERADRLGGSVLYAAPAEPAGDLVGELAAAGVPARAVVVYETLARSPDGAVAGALNGAHAVLLHSPKAARALAAWLAAHPAPDLIAVCLSPAVAAPLAGLGRESLAALATAERPDEAALLARLAHSLGDGS